MKIKLLSCRSPFLDDDRIYPPLANLYVHTAIQREHPDWNVFVTDDYSLENPDWLRRVDAVGISIMTPQREEASKLLDFIKQHSKARVVAGGPHAKFYGQELQKEGWDCIVTHDAERVTTEAFTGNRRVITDSITPADFSKHAVKPERNQNGHFLSNFKYSIEGRKATTMMTARGCPMACRFCEDANTKVRWTPLSILEEEMDDIMNLGYKAVYIFDDMFAMSVRQLAPIAKMLKERNLIYRCNGHAGRMNDEMAHILADSGCREIAFGAESGSQQILDRVNKKTTVQQNYDFIETAHRYGIKVKAFMMIGLPGETRQTISETEKFIEDSKVDSFGLYVYYPYKGTEFRDLMDRKAPIDLYFLGEGLGAYGTAGGRSECRVRTTDLSYDQLQAERDRIAQRFCIQPVHGLEMLS